MPDQFKVGDSVHLHGTSIDAEIIAMSEKHPDVALCRWQEKTGTQELWVAVKSLTPAKGVSGSGTSNPVNLKIET